MDRSVCPAHREFSGQVFRHGDVLVEIGVANQIRDPDAAQQSAVRYITDRSCPLAGFFDNCLVTTVPRAIDKIELLIPDLDPVAVLQKTVRLAVPVDEYTMSTVAVNDEVFVLADPIWAGLGDDIRMVTAYG